MKKNIRKTNKVTTQVDKKHVIHLFRTKKGHSYTMRQLYRELDVHTSAAKKHIEQLVATLCNNKKLEKRDKGGYILASAATYVVGRVDYVRAEYAYIILPEYEKDVIVKRHNLASALDKDLVKVGLFDHNGRKNRIEGKVVEIIERSKTPIIGRLIKKEGGWAVLVDQKRVTFQVWVKPENLNEAVADDKVVIRLTNDLQMGRYLWGSITKVLGQTGIHEVEIHAIMAEFGLEEHFPSEVLAAAQSISATITIAEIKKRRDLRAIPTFTIDPIDAKDFDDAISYQVLSNGNYQIGIHIADVTHYVQPDTIIDQEAYHRNTSVYLIDRTIPMLPENLSNQLCSLNPYEDKLTFSAIFELNTEGVIQDEWFGETVIHSDKRFSYEEAQEVIDTQQGDFVVPLTQLNKLAKKIGKQRFQAGAINIETKELKFELDEEGKPLQVVTKVRGDTHKLVEEFMLLANKRVASYAAKLAKKEQIVGATFIFRTHDAPESDKVDDFLRFVKQVGYKINLSPKLIAQTMNELETAIQGKQIAEIIQSLAIRTMAKALYTTEKKPHFALAFAHYTHFTSPIRRYPDIMVHRLLKQYLAGNKPVLLPNYEKKCQYALERERIAAEAERASIKYKQVELMQTLTGEVLEGVIGSITEWGIYVEILSNGCEGMIRLADMSDDYYTFEAKKFRVIGERQKKVYRIGDIVRVRVKSCDLNKRYVDFVLVHQ